MVGLQYSNCLEKIRAFGLEGLVHTTASNQTGDHFHIILPLAAPVSWGEQERAVRAFCRFMEPSWRPDTTKLASDCLYYVPAATTAPTTTLIIARAMCWPRPTGLSWRRSPRRKNGPRPRAARVPQQRC
jgi:hypothetical protein